MAIAFQIDNSSVPAPSSVQIERHRANPREMADGGWHLSKRLYGDIIHFIWGKDAVAPGVRAAVASALGTTLEHNFKWVDPDTTAFDVDGSWDGNLPLSIVLGYQVGTFEIVVYARSLS